MKRKKIPEMKAVVNDCDGAILTPEILERFRRKMLSTDRRPSEVVWPGSIKPASKGVKKK